MNENEIVDVSSVVTKLQYFLDEYIEWVEVEIRENLTREIADGKSDTRRREKQALWPWKSNPVFSSPFYNAVGRRVVLYHFFTKPEEFFVVISDIFHINNFLNLREKNILIDIHKKSLNVEFQNIGVFCIVLSGTSDECVDSFNPEQSSFFLATAVGIVNE